MRMIKITASTMQEALDRVRTEIGPDAVILSIKGSSRKGIFKFFGKKQVEITAAADRQNIFGNNGYQADSMRPGGNANGYGGNGFNGYNPYNAYPPAPPRIERGPTNPASSASPASRSVAVPEIEDRGALEGIKNELSGIKEALDSLMRRSEREGEPILPGSLFEAYNHMLANGFEPRIAELILEEVKGRMRPEDYSDIAKIRELVTEYVRGLIPVSGPIRVDKGKRKMVALVGPTGVGKTTTIAKLAATYSLKMKKKVGLITTDTYRIAALEQLMTYAKIIGVPAEVVYTPDDMEKSLKTLSSCDLILMDTPGRNPRSFQKIDELAELMRSCNPDEIHLVISATTRDAEAVDLIRRFEPVGFDKLIFTKTDESISFGMLLNVLIKAKCPISYLGTGQSVPQDFMVADRKSIAEMIVGNWSDRGI